MFINISNHPTSKWGPEQLATAEALGGVVQDLPFPAVDPEASTEDIRKLAAEYVADVLAMSDKPVCMVSGEFTFTYALVKALLDAGVPCCAATTAREVTEKVAEDGSVQKVANFRFVKFRFY